MDKKQLIKELVNELSANNLAIFAGAGLSVSAGFVNWKELLTDLAEELHLDINKEENDLVSLAQYYINEKRGNRSKINQIILNEFSQKAEITENHRILARLPIDTFWTTNYDKVIETALEEAGKVVDVKHCVEQLPVSIQKRDAVIYKMHGDYTLPNQTVLIKDDYEKYHLTRNDFFTALRGDLLTKRFLFLGFSFADPNIDYILSRIRASYSENQKEHYCILRKVQKFDNEDQADFEYRQRKQQLFISDLERVGVNTLLIDEYSEITEILREVEQAQKRKTVFISGAAEDYAPYNQEDIEQFVSSLAQDILKLGYRIVTGFGLGVGSSVISGSIKYLTEQRLKIDEDYLILRPFPQNKEGIELWSAWRKDMISYAGISIFLFGNKSENGNIVLSNGMQEEFDISKRNGNILIPVASTGYMAKQLWEKDLNQQYDEKFKAEMGALSQKNSTLDELKSNILSILKKVK
ncbi:SIR2 family protein [Actinobacillus equuli subsp. equuli]|uniref:NAD(+) hydrolase ThsA n=1 Tax=Actinobacillus equuli subsp. equuli TaxID=202947 RepID=A0A9X4G565_ACTEU|nr:SIR2 family protein [Actinobacillus equuli]MDE8034480.1 SIR2 family protein [Actinobacillus equuli subsp. equuli]MDG4947527.1 SIR2 family protein [Actinobacillus equuli subsp. haemolyticus]